MSCAPNVSIVIEKLPLFNEIDISHFFYPESVHLPRSRAGRSLQQVELRRDGLAPHQVDFPDFLLATHARDRTGERSSTSKFFYPCMKPPCSPLMGEGLGVRVRVPAVVTFPALVITTISFRSISQHKLLGNLSKFVGGLAPKKPNPSK
jgi:hypothetical protein